MHPLLRFAISLVCLVAAPVRAESEWQCFKQLICLEIAHNDDQAVVYAHNRLKVPAGVKVAFRQLVNLRPVPRLRGRVAEAVVSPGAQELVVVLVREDMRRSARFPFDWKFSYGDPGAVHEPHHAYQMPFGGSQPCPLTQGANGRFTHKGRSRWSFDFGMAIGTPILAARAGTVVEVTDGYTRSGITEDFLDRANAVTLLHEDGTFATYAHLDPGSAVREGMQVVAGELIGFSGNTGFSTGPHLHFSVWKGSWDGGTTLPIRFRWEGGRGRLVEGRAYAPTLRVEAASGSGGGSAAAQAPPATRYERLPNGSCRCRNGAVITTRLPCRTVCP